MSETRTKVDALVDLGKKITGQDINAEENETIVGMLDKITKNYTGGGGGTDVVANPILAGNESVLTGLQVGETKYAVVGKSIDYIDSDTNIYDLIEGIYEVVGGINLSYSSEGSFTTAETNSASGVAGYLLVLNSASNFMYFEATGDEEYGQAWIKFGVAGESNGAVGTFTLMAE